jgi:predicted  nucleic acid-binding Zn-ribbon protein
MKGADMAGHEELDPQKLDEEHERLSAELKELRGKMDEMDKQSHVIQKDIDANASNSKEHERLMKRA